jgi:phage I-like protein
MIQFKQLCGWIARAIPSFFPELRRASTRLINSVDRATGLIGLANRFEASTEGAQEWVQISPYGDFRHKKGIQRVDKRAGEAMVNNFQSLSAKLARRFGGLPFYIGHPDYPEAAKDYPDKKAYGWINELQARDDGVYARVDWSTPGKEMLANAHYKFCSPHWNADKPAIENGQKIYRPSELVSVGLTNEPNLPVNPLANETEADENEPLMNRTELIQIFGLANDATDEQIKTKVNAAAAAITALANAQTEKANAATALANEQNAKAGIETELTTARTSFANERKARIELLVDNAIAQGRIAKATRAQWVTDLEADFDGKSVALANSKAGIHTQAHTANGGNRREALINTETEFTTKVQGLVNERMRKTGEDYQTAWVAVKQENAALFQQAAGKN